MGKNPKSIAISGLIFSGALALGAGAAWSQSGTNSDQIRSGTGMSENVKQWSSEDIRHVQQALKDKGHNPGKIDGVRGPRTQQALRDFQGAQNIQATGHMDSRTASALGVSMSSSSMGSDGSTSMGSTGRNSSTTGSSSSGMSGGTSTDDAAGIKKNSPATGNSSTGAGGNRSSSPDSGSSSKSGSGSSTGSSSSASGTTSADDAAGIKKSSPATGK